MSRRIGIITFQMPQTAVVVTPPVKGGKPPVQSNTPDQRKHYIWDIKTLAHLEIYANVVKNWTRADIVELTWCNRANVVFHPELAYNEQREFVFYEKEETIKKDIAGSDAEGLYLEYVASFYFNVIDDQQKFQRRIGFPAPVTSIFARGGKISTGIGTALEDTLEQVTGAGIFKFSSGYLKIFPIIEDER